jgi:SAM-dependent methyltransferase
MEPDAVRELYDPDTARTYNERWHGNPWGNDTQHLAEAIGRRVHEGVRWLDVGCGTGHFLSRFPGIQRAGTDLSPSMLAEARAASPDALFFEEWDFRNDNPAWRDGFTLITCTGEPWSYVDTIAETERFVANLANWTAPGGTCLLAAQDPLDLTGMRLPYYIPGEPGFPGEITLKAVVWSMSDRSHEHIPEIGVKWHHDMVWPLLEHWIATFGLYFRTIIIETLPHDPPWLNTPRRVLIAKDKRGSGDLTPVNVIHTNAGMAYNEMVAPVDQAEEAHVSEPEASPEAPAPMAPAPVSEPEAPHQEPPAAARATTEPDAPAGPIPLRDIPIGRFAAKFKPWKPSFYKSAARRGYRRLRR